jgi:hypothetical protein
MPRSLRAYCHPRKDVETCFLGARLLNLRPGVPLATMNVRSDVSDRPRSRDRMSLRSEGLDPSTPNPQFAGERIGSTENDVWCDSCNSD